jgi:hypothetical protein
MLPGKNLLPVEREAHEGVPKPSPKTTAAPCKDKRVNSTFEELPKSDGCGKPPGGAAPALDAEPAESEPAFKAAEEIARHSVRQILQNYGQQLNRGELIRIDQIFHRELIPRRKPGRRLLARITRAYAAYQSGQRGVALYRAHIPGWSSMSKWRRNGEERKMMAAIRSRRLRATSTGTVKLVSASKS